jgi:pilus assembly protein CpaC
MRIVLAPLALLLVAAAPQTIEVVAGRAVTLPLDRHPARLFIADPGVADLAAGRDGTVYVTGRAAGETSYSAVDAAGRTIAAGPVLVRYDEAGLAKALARAVPAARVDIATAKDSLVLSGTVPSAAEGDDAVRIAARFVAGGDPHLVINRLAVTAPTQVNLQVRVAEVSRDVLKQFGFNWQALGGLGSHALIGIATGHPVLASPVQGDFQTRQNNTDSAFASYRDGRTDLNVLIDALDDKGLVTVLAEPNLTALSGSPASFLAGGEYPVPVPQGLGTTAIEYKKYGVSLAFVATVGEGGRITLNVRPEVSQLTTSGGITLQGITVPALTTRRAETTVELGSGQAFAIAGLLERTGRRDLRQFPLLGDIPVIGELFRSRRYERGETELVIIVMPSLVAPVAPETLALPKPLDTRP